MYTTNILDRLGYKKLSYCSKGEIVVPLEYYEKADWVGYPPALLPILTDGSSPNYIGLWKNWLNGDSSFVNLSLTRAKADEVARTEKQLFAYLVITAIVAKDEVTQEILDFAERVGVSNIEELDEGTIKFGDDVREFKNISDFKLNCPLESSDPGEYDGYFPTETNGKGNFSSSYQIEEEDLGLYGSLPIWFRKEKAVESFERYMKEENYMNAWLSLNSRGWLFFEAAEAITEIAKKVSVPEFSSLATEWANLAKNTVGGY